MKPAEEWWQTFPIENLPDYDLSDPVSCRKAVRGADWVFNLAADMGGMGRIHFHKLECMLSVLITTNLLKAAYEADVSRYLYASSACVYAAARQEDAAVTPLREEDAYPAMPEDGYGWEKLFGERLARHYREDAGLETRIPRFHNVFGPRGSWTGGREKAIASLSRKIAEAKVSGRDEIEIWGDGRQTRSFCFVDDAVDGVMRLMASDFPDPLNIGSDRLVTINELVTMLERIAGISVRRRYDPTMPQGVRGRNSDNTLCRQVLGWEPSTPLEVGLVRTYEWIEENVRAEAGR